MLRFILSSAATLRQHEPSSSCVHPYGSDVAASERMNLRVFAFLVPIASDKTTHPAWVAIEKTGALTDKPARELAAVSQEQCNVVIWSLGHA